MHLPTCSPVINKGHDKGVDKTPSPSWFLRPPLFPDNTLPVGGWGPKIGYREVEPEVLVWNPPQHRDSTPSHTA